MSRIKNISINNVKFFYGDNLINLEEKNILLYGENGSGKSSVYWALYTFLQSSFKEAPQVLKYFDARHSENLRNRFSDDASESSISLEFSDGIIRKISNLGISTKTASGDNFILEATLGSDLIENRTLSSIYHFARQDEIDLFYFFRNNLLPFINLRNTFQKHDGTPGSNNADIFWKYIDSGIQIYTDAEEDKSVEIFEPIVTQFNVDFEAYLNTISESTNLYLVEKFKQDVKIKIIYKPAIVKENYIDEVKKHIYAEKPSIILEAHLVSDKLDEDKKRITDPQSFLNESKLTALALAMRLAILDEKFVQAYPKILVLDDMLMSMDMSNREFVLGIILENYLVDYQILFFTHQRGLFEDARRYIINYHALQSKNAGESNETINKIAWENKWKVFEMYESKDISQIPIPKIQEFGSTIQKALFYFNKHIDYSACGNNLRAALEEYFRVFIPENKFRNVNGDPIDEKKLMLHELLQYATRYFADCNFDVAPLIKLDRYRERSLNPASHYNPRAEFYKKELEEIFAILDSFKLNRRIPVVKIDNELKFEIRTTNNVVYSYTAMLLDDLNVYSKSDGNPNYYIPNDIINIAFTSCLVDGVPGNSGQRIGDTLQGIYDRMIRFIERNGDLAIPSADIYQTFMNINNTTLENLKLI